VRCNINIFNHYLTKAVKSILDNKKDKVDNKDVERSHLKRHTQFLVHSQLDTIIKKLIP
jgi:hypothetical protein